MSGWIDPLGTRALHRYIQSEQHRLERLVEEHRRPSSRRLSKYRARIEQLGQIHALIQALERNGSELLPYKDLVMLHPDRREMIEALVARDVPMQ